MEKSGPSATESVVDVLAVDDDAIMNGVVRRIVEHMGHRCVTASSGEQALEVLGNEDFDLVITDINMAELSGLDLLNSVKAAKPDVAVVVVSGVNDASTADIAIASGAYGYVVKPFELTELQIAIANALRRRELEIELHRHLNDLESEVERRTAQLRAATNTAVNQERRFRSLAQASPLGIIYINRDWEFDYCNSKAEALLGRCSSEMKGTKWFEGMPGGCRQTLGEAVAAAADGTEADCEHQLQRPDESLIWLRCRTAPVMSDEGAISGVVVLLEDIDDRVRLEAMLRHQATHDHLTGLPNRRQFREYVGELVDSNVDGRYVAVLLVDLDQFKLVNDTYGHEAGDQLVVATAARLADVAPPNALTARVGGDEFVIAVTTSTEDEALEVAETVRTALREPVKISEVELSLSASVGIGLASNRDTSVDSLLRTADIAMHRAKERRDSVEVFDDSMASDTARRLSLTSELRTAVSRDGLDVHYQAILSCVDNSLMGFESLARWTHEEWGRVPPNEFIPIAEQIGIVHAIDLFVLRQAVRQLAEWKACQKVSPHVFVTVNLSASQLSNSNLPNIVESALGNSGLDGLSLCIEVTESSLIVDMDRAIPVLNRLREMGVRLAVDDFGTGHSALSYLGRLPLDILKIDKSFVDDLGTETDVVETIVELAHKFGLAVIAEGVEVAEQLVGLRQLNCDMSQGFFLDRPTPADCINFDGSGGIVLLNELPDCRLESHLDAVR